MTLAFRVKLLFIGGFIVESSLLKSSYELPRKRALLLALDDWAAPYHLCRNLVDVGFDLRAIFPSTSVLSQTRFLPRGGCLSPLQKLCSVTLAAENRFGKPALLRKVGAFATRRLAVRLLALAEQWTPDIIIPLDDRAIRLCRDLIAGRGGRLPPSVTALLIRSVGDPVTLDQRLSRAGNCDAARGAGVRTPLQISVTDQQTARRFAHDVGYPIVAKAEHSAGGVGITICRDEKALFEALRGSLFKSRMGRLSSLLTRWFRPRHTANRQYILQQFVVGVPTMREVFCWEGRVVAGFSLAKMQSATATGAASVVRTIDNAGMERATAGLVEALGLTGFADVDFIVDKDGAALCIELNARPTGLTHLGTRFGCSLERALHAMLTGDAFVAPPPPIVDETVAIFPKEWFRDPNSEALKSAYHDVPWDDPKIINYYAAKQPIA